MEENQSLQAYNQQTRADHITAAISLWIESKFDESKSIRTRETYWHYITMFRTRLQLVGLDLDGLPVSHSPTQEDKDAAIVKLSIAAQGWASGSMRGDKIISAATYNQRVSVLSSFYAFVRKRRLLIMDNPIDLLDRREVQEYANAQAISREKVERVLKMIDRSIWAGKRDYALLLVFFTTGRRASEVLSLQWRHVEPIEDTAILHFEHCKGGKKMSDKLEPFVWQALRDYLATVIFLR